jgi:hypothetical protein
MHLPCSRVVERQREVERALSEQRQKEEEKVKRSEALAAQLKNKEVRASVGGLRWLHGDMCICMYTYCSLLVPHTYMAVPVC